MADLRPVADAAASRRQTEIAVAIPPAPAAAFPPVSPPSAVAKGEVGRSLLAAVTAGTDVSANEGEGERRLKPWGVAMLPHEAPKPPPADEAPRPVDTERSRSARVASPDDSRTRPEEAVAIRPDQSIEGPEREAPEPDPESEGDAADRAAGEDPASGRPDRPVP